MGLDDAREIFKSGAVTGIGVKVKDEYKVSSVKSALEDTLGFSFSVRSWMELDKNLMKALAMEKRMMFIVLGLIVLVACFNICASLIMMVMEKTKDIGILKAIGANSGGIGAVFLCVGFATGFTGSLVGGASGFFIAKYINQIAGFVEDIAGIEFFPSDIYYFSEIPSKIVMNDVFGIMAFSLALALISGIYPAIQASRLDPIDAIRYE
jgi:lipoprotein-releasing system permease protein